MAAATKQTYVWSTPFFDFEFVDIRTKRSKGNEVIITIRVCYITQSSFGSISASSTN